MGDVHWQEYSSILRKQGNVFSIRLEKLIDSINFVENQAKINGVDAIVYLGDFFDSSSINYNEITALSDVQWNCNVMHYFLVGNHEISTIDTTKSTAHIFREMGNGFITVDSITSIKCDDTYICFLPYIRENWKLINEYFPNMESKIVFSHNDIKGIQMGKWVSQDGLDLEDISNNCTLFFNGHLHNNQKLCHNVFNVGILSGRDFGEDATIYDHLIYVLDTTTKQYHTIVNPYAFNFYKFDVKNSILDLSNLKPNAVVTIRCNDANKDDIKNQLNSCSNILEYRLIIEPTLDASIEKEHIDLSVNHIEEFKKYCLSVIDNTDTLKQELNIICG